MSSSDQKFMRREITPRAAVVYLSYATSAVKFGSIQIPDKTQKRPKFTKQNNPMYPSSYLMQNLRHCPFKVSSSLRSACIHLEFNSFHKVHLIIGYMPHPQSTSLLSLLSRKKLSRKTLPWCVGEALTWYYSNKTSSVLLILK